MISVPVYNQAGKEIGKQELPKKYFGIEINPALVNESVVSILAARRASSAHTKTRGEVRGGGKKPWKQKGTGRARHGSSRSPIWKGGGVTFGPRNEKNYVKHVNAKARRKALLMVLTDKVKEKKLVVIDAITLSEAKTKHVAKLFSQLPKLRSALVVIDAQHKAFVQASRNMKGIDATAVRNLNVYDVMRHEGLVLTQKSVALLLTFLGGK